MHKRNLEIKGLSKEGRLLFPYIRRQTLKSEESIERGMGYGRIYEKKRDHAYYLYSART